MFPSISQKKRANLALFFWVSDGARTHDTRNHNPMLYQLNYTHHVGSAKVVIFSGIAKTLG